MDEKSLEASIPNCTLGSGGGAPEAEKYIGSRGIPVYELW